MPSIAASGRTFASLIAPSQEAIGYDEEDTDAFEEIDD
ncbi:MAG: hypothetical protein RL461_221, partial [Planctomycetota bacterium]